MACCNCPTNISPNCNGPTACPPNGLDLTKSTLTFTLNMTGFLQYSFSFSNLIFGGSSYQLISPRLVSDQPFGSAFCGGGNTCCYVSNPAGAIILPDPGDFFNPIENSTTVWRGCSGQNESCIFTNTCSVQYLISIGFSQSQCGSCSSIGVGISASYSYYPANVFGVQYVGGWSASYGASFPAFCSWGALALTLNSVSQFVVNGPAACGLGPGPSPAKVFGDYTSLPSFITVTR